MDKFKNFYTRAMADDAVRAEVKKILGKTPVNDTTDEAPSTRRACQNTRH